MKLHELIIKLEEMCSFGDENMDVVIGAGGMLVEIKSVERQQMEMYGDYINLYGKTREVIVIGEA